MKNLEWDQVVKCKCKECGWTWMVINVPVGFKPIVCPFSFCQDELGTTQAMAVDAS